MRAILLPRSLPELWEALGKEPEARLFSGGTDLLVQLREGTIDAPALVGLERIGELKGVREENGFLWIGAGSTHTELLTSPLIRRALPVLSQALGQLGSPLIRNMGTIGGNICTASPAGDTLPPLYLLDAALELRSSTGSREMPLREFITGPGKTRIDPGEILAGIRVHIPPGNIVHHFEKVGPRRSLSCAIASLAALIRVSETGRILDARLAWGSVAPTVWTLPQVEAALIGQTISRDVLEEAANLVKQAVSPIDDLRATAAYRRDVSGNLLSRLLMR